MKSLLLVVLFWIGFWYALHVYMACKSMLLFRRKGCDISDINSLKIRDDNPEDLDETLRSALTDYDREIQAMGYSRLCFASAGDPTIYQTFSLVHTKPNCDDRCVVEAVCQSMGKRSVVVSWIGYGSEFSDGSQCHTINSDRMGEITPNKHVWNLPKCDDASALHEAHTAFVRDSGKPTTSAPATAEEWLEMQTARFKIELERSIQKGLIKQDSTGVNQYTLRTLFLICRPYIIPGFNPWLQRKHRVRSRHQLRSLGLAHLWKTEPMTADH